MKVADEELYTEVRSALLGSIQTFSMVKDAFNMRKNVHPSGKVVVLDKYIPWQKAIVQLEEL